MSLPGPTLHVEILTLFLKTKKCSHSINARDLEQGTNMLTLWFLPLALYS